MYNNRNKNNLYYICIINETTILNSIELSLLKKINKISIKPNEINVFINYVSMTIEPLCSPKQE